MSFTYANKGLRQYLHFNITFIYTLLTLTINNLIIADFDNPQVASTTNPSAFGYHYSEHMLCICPEKAYINKSIQAQSSILTPIK